MLGPSRKKWAIDHRMFERLLLSLSLQETLPFAIVEDTSKNKDFCFNDVTLGPITGSQYDAYTVLMLMRYF